MQETFDQLGNLLLDAVPTILLFILLVIAYRWLIYGPLTRVFERRRALTVGAVEDARRAIERAEAEAAEYAGRLRQARAEAYRAREHRLQERNAESEAALGAARKAASARVEDARAGLEGEAATAREAIQASAADLASQVVRAVLPVVAGGAR